MYGLHTRADGSPAHTRADGCLVLMADDGTPSLTSTHTTPSPVFHRCNTVEHYTRGELCAHGETSPPAARVSTVSTTIFSRIGWNNVWTFVHNARTRGDYPFRGARTHRAVVRRDATTRRRDASNARPSWKDRY